MSDDDITRAERARSGNPFFNTAQAGHYLGLSTRMLERMRRRGEGPAFRRHARSEEHTSELQSLMRISYAVFCLKKKKHTTQTYNKCHHLHRPTQQSTKEN